MSLTTDRRTTNGPADLTAAELVRIVAWGDEHGLEVTIRLSGAAYPEDVAFVGYGEAIPSWTVYRAEGHLWLRHMEGVAGPGCEALPLAVMSVEEALAEIISDTEI